MFGGGKVKALEERLDRLEATLEGRIQEARAALQAEVREQMKAALGRLEADPNERLALLVEAVEGALGDRVSALEPQLDRAAGVLARVEALTAPMHAVAREDVAFGKAVTAKQTGLLSLWQDFGRSDHVKVQVTSEGKEQVIGWTNTTRGLSGSFSAVIRAGETYRLESQAVHEHNETGMRASFTPFSP